jgi:hypothetical protein
MLADRDAPHSAALLGNWPGIAPTDEEAPHRAMRAARVNRGDYSASRTVRESRRNGGTPSFLR